MAATDEVVLVPDHHRRLFNGRVPFQTDGARVCGRVAELDDYLFGGGCRFLDVSVSLVSVAAVSAVLVVVAVVCLFWLLVVVVVNMTAVTVTVTNVVVVSVVAAVNAEKDAVDVKEKQKG